MGAAIKSPDSKSKPELGSYLDYRLYLKDWLAYQKASRSGLSLRAVAKAAGIAPAYLSMVISGTRPLTGKLLPKLLPLLDLTESEQAYFEHLMVLGTSESQDVRLRALDRMKRFRAYRDQNPRELEVHQYLTRWYYVAIREMASLPGFKANAEWIQGRLRSKVGLKEIREALEFLTDRGYLEVLPEGGAKPPEKRLECEGGVYNLSLAGFHRQMLALASDAIENTPREQRSLVGHAFAADASTVERAREILREALEKIQALQPKASARDSVYFVELALFPFTKKESV